MTRVVRGSEVTPSRWANGQGWTRELWLDPGAPGRPRWRLSMALVDGAGEFSVLPGVARSLMLVSGECLLQRGDGDWEALGAPIAFDGALPVRYDATGAEDLGVMVWDGPPAPLAVREVREPLPLDARAVRAAVVLGGNARLGPSVLGFRDTVVCDGDDDATLVPLGHLTVALVGR